jgi:hypothetical protein
MRVWVWAHCSRQKDNAWHQFLGHKKLLLSQGRVRFDWLADADDEALFVANLCL